MVIKTVVSASVFISFMTLLCVASAKADTIGKFVRVERIHEVLKIKNTPLNIEKLKTLGFVSGGSHTLLREKLWRGTFMGNTPVLFMSGRGIILREVIDLSKPNYLPITILIPGGAEELTLKDSREKTPVISLLSANVYGGWKTVADFIAETQAEDIVYHIKHTKR